MSFAAYWSKLVNEPVEVLHSCSCGRPRSIHELFFCATPNCARFVCDKCTQITIDTFFCPSCLNSCFSSMAIKTKNCCETCLECPVCSHTLTAIAAAAPGAGAGAGAPAASDAAGSVQHEYVCEGCEWSSVSVGVTGATAVAAIAKANELDHDRAAEDEFFRLSKVYTERYKQTLKEKLADGKSDAPIGLVSGPIRVIGGGATATGAVASTPTGGSTMQQHFAAAAAALAATNASANSSGGSAPPPLQAQHSSSNADGDVLRAIEHLERQRVARTHEHYRLPAYAFTPNASQAAAAAAHLHSAAAASAGSSAAIVMPPFAAPTAMYGGGSKPIDAYAAPSLTQRLNRTNATALVPRRKHLLTKLAHRCNKCSKFVLKPSALAANVNFDSKNMAISAVPRITVGAVPPLATDKKVKFIVYFRNSSLWPMKIVVTACNLAPKPAPVSTSGSAPPAADSKTDAKAAPANAAPTAATPAFLNPNATLAADGTATISTENARFSFSTQPVTVNEWDDIAEQDDAMLLADRKTDPTSVTAAAAGEQVPAYRHLSKTGIWVEVTPTSDNRPLRCSFNVAISTDAAAAEVKSFAFDTHIAIGATSSAAGNAAVAAAATDHKTA